MRVEALRATERLLPTADPSRFDSGVPNLGRWLHNSAPVAARAGTAATYVLCRGQRVVGYYALAMSAVLHADAPSRLRHGMPDPVPVVLLARLAVDRTEQGNRLGGHLFLDALRRCVRGGGVEFGARAVVVDAIDARAAEFYRHFDFHELDQNRLWRRLTDIATARTGRGCAASRPGPGGPRLGDHIGAVAGYS